MKLSEKLKRHKNVYTLPSNANADMPSVAFVIPVYNSSASLQHCVKSIFRQTRLDLIREVILVDDGSTDDSMRVIKLLCEQYDRVKCHKNDRRYGAAYSRNRGVELSDSDIICFIDSDILLPVDYVQQHAMQHSVGPCITFSLRINIINPSNVKPSALADDSDFRTKLLRRQDSLRDVSFSFSTTHTLAELCLTCAVSYRRNDLVRVKGCPENFVGWGFNDTAMAAKVIALERPVIHIPHATVHHLEHSPRSGNVSKKWSEFSRNRQRYLRMLEMPVEATFAYNIEELDREAAAPVDFA